MILTSAPQNEAVLSNVGEIGEFRIRNSAKAFNILSSGLYSNKIKAVIRELSCNAVDAHVAAGKKDVPFEVHLPNGFEPWFSVRDFGVGLNHDQVTNIYTTYFESTKTNSNDFVGGLGLGSKSPFSYTDNFSVTAVKDGRKGIYTAFINEQGVPSIALMTEEQTTEANGVEVKFSVNERFDFEKFRSEARNVFAFFELHPTIKGYNEYKKLEHKYETKDIIPGVHSYDGSFVGSSRAVMGNIPYPIEIPNAHLVLGDNLVKLLKCGLEIHFEIGELDFQASREGLSYIGPTIAAIKAKLQALVLKLTVHLSNEANQIPNMWKRSVFLHQKRRNSLWSAAVTEYVKNTKFPLYKDTYWLSNATIEIFSKDLESKYNLMVRGFTYNGSTCSTTKFGFEYDGTPSTTGVQQKFEKVDFTVSNHVKFIKNDTKVGATERAKYHWRNEDEDANTVYILEPVDKTKPVLFDAFFKDIYNPPEDQIVLASELTEKPRSGSSGVGKAVNLLKLEGRAANSWSSLVKYSWQSAGLLSALDSTKTYYYIPLKGFELKSKYNYPHSGGDLAGLMKSTGLPGIHNIDVYGVRKGDMETIETMKNWINVEDHIVSILSNVPKDVIMGVAKEAVGKYSFMRWDQKLYGKLNQDSPIRKLYDEFANVKDVKINDHGVKSLSNYYCKNSNFDLTVYLSKYTKECDDILAKYPMLGLVYGYETGSPKLADYVNTIDFVTKLQSV